jgi:hypothetical protein
MSLYGCCLQGVNVWVVVAGCVLVLLVVGCGVRVGVRACRRLRRGGEGGEGVGGGVIGGGGRRWRRRRGMSCWGWREGKRGIVRHIRVKWRGIFEFRLWIYRVM